MPQFEAEEVLAAARDARFEGVQGRAFAGFRTECRLREDADTGQLIFGQVFPARLLSEFGDTDLGIRRHGPSSILTWAHDRIAGGDLTGGGAERKRGDENGAAFGAQRELRIHFLEQDLPRALECQARERVRLNRRDSRFAFNERQFGFARPASSGGGQVSHRQERRERDEVGVAGRQGEGGLLGELAAGEV